VDSNITGFAGAACDSCRNCNNNLNASSIYVVALDPQVDDIYYAIVETARTGQHGDGIVFISNVERVINIYHLGRT
jgi:nitrogen regulatory protein PII